MDFFLFRSRDVAITMNSVKMMHAVRSAITAIAELLVRVSGQGFEKLQFTLKRYVLAQIFALFKSVEGFGLQVGCRKKRNPVGTSCCR